MSGWQGTCVLLGESGRFQKPIATLRGSHTYIECMSNFF